LQRIPLNVPVIVLVSTVAVPLVADAEIEAEHVA
jgi:hypothetical protein